MCQSTRLHIAQFNIYYVMLKLNSELHPAIDFPAYDIIVDDWCESYVCLYESSHVDSPHCNTAAV